MSLCGRSPFGQRAVRKPAPPAWRGSAARCARGPPRTRPGCRRLPQAVPPSRPTRTSPRRRNTAPLLTREGGRPQGYSDGCQRQEAAGLHAGGRQAPESLGVHGDHGRGRHGDGRAADDRLKAAVATTCRTEEGREVSTGMPGGRGGRCRFVMRHTSTQRREQRPLPGTPCCVPFPPTHAMSSQTATARSVRSRRWATRRGAPPTVCGRGFAAAPAPRARAETVVELVGPPVAGRGRPRGPRRRACAPGRDLRPSPRARLPRPGSGSKLGIQGVLVSSFFGIVGRIRTFTFSAFAIKLLR